MKINETIGIFEASQAVSPEAFKAQRMAELKDLAEYRARRMAAYTDWVKPENIAKRKAEHEAAAPAALALGQELSAKAKAQMEAAKHEKAPRPKLVGITVTPIAWDEALHDHHPGGWLELKLIWAMIKASFKAIWAKLD